MRIARLLASILAIVIIVGAGITAIGPSGDSITRSREGVLPEHVEAVLKAGEQPPTHITARPQAKPQVKGTGRFDDERILGVIGQDWEPALAVDPTNPNRVYHLVTRFGGAKACPTCPDPAIILKRSLDRGQTWLPDQFLCGVPCAGTGDQDDPLIEVANDGSVYAVWMESYVPGVSFARSTDYGVTWTAPVHVSGALAGTPNWYSDKPWFAISPTGQDVYVNMSAGTNNGDNYAITSHDFGATFAPPIKVNPTAALYWYGEGAAVAPNGDVYFANSADPASGSTLQVTRSTDDGASWTSQQLDTSFGGAACGGGCPSFFLNAQSSLAIDPNGLIMYVYPSNTVNKGAKTLYFKTSTDGTTWSARAVINSAGDSNFPQVVSSAPGVFHVAWMDNSAGSWNVQYRRTLNSGATWGNQKTASNLATGASYKSATGFGSPYGDYFEMGTVGNQVHLIWGEGVSYSGNGNVWYTRLAHKRRPRH